MLNAKKWQHAEKWIFLFVTIAGMIPLLTTKFFPSLDGASHLYNTNIINQIFFWNNKFFQQFFMLNPEPVPNWTSHFILVLLKLFLPAFLAEKILVILLLAGIPLAFRNLMFTLSPKNILYSYLVFPFTHSMFLFFGFFNFCIAVLCFLIAINYWLKHEESPWTLKKILTLTILIAITYFSHIVIFGILLIVIATRIMVVALAALICNTGSTKSVLRNFLVQAFTVTAAALVPLILFVYFFYTRPGTRQITFIAREELIRYLITIRPLISFNTASEGKITVVLFYLIAALLVAGLIIFTLRFIRSGKTHTPFIFPSINGWWLMLSSGIILFLYFSLPDAYGTASYTNLRLGFIFFLLIILWMSTFRMPQWIGIVAILGGMYVHIHLLSYYTPIVRDYGKMALSCNKAAEKISPNSLVLPIYVMDNWFTGHFVDYIGVDKPVLLVYNYECLTGYFPVIWNVKDKPNYFLGSPSNPDAYINFEEKKGRPSLALNYVFVVGNYDPGKDWFFTTLHRTLQEEFVCVYTSEYCSLYHKKP
ncbi:MAG: hypothetical protein WCI71_07560 [Bacteroidota bacterium]